MLTVLTWLWAQPGVKSAYSAEHVNIWAGMVRRHLTIPHRIACVTDLAAGIDPSVEIIAPPGEFEDVRIPTWQEHRPQCLRRLTMFRRDAAKIFGERFVCMDLDTVIAGNIDSLFTGNEDFRIFAGTTSGRPYNGSMMMLRAGARPEVYERFTPAKAIEAGRRFIGSDQAWITYCLKGEATWSAEHGVGWYNSRMPAGRPPRLMFFPGSPKPWQLVNDGREPWVQAHYRAASQARPALILGYGPTVWQDLEAALPQGPFGAVIASPEAARHWPQDVLATANDDNHARRLAAMHGFQRVVECGVTEPRRAVA
jgi:hypothetical protein